MTSWRVLTVYAALCCFEFLLAAAQGFGPDVITHALILALFAVQLFLLDWLRSALRRVGPKWRFVAPSMFFAALVEGSYMISKPLDPSLLITKDTPVQEAFRRLAVDLVLTTPAYAVIFWFMWRLISRFRYALWEFVILMAAGQALGDANEYLRGTPSMLLFLPYLMLNYHAMQVVPFLLVREELEANASGWKRVALPLVGLPAVYLVCGFSVKLVGAALGLLPWP
jgi:hypothetical protein